MVGLTKKCDFGIQTASEKQLKINSGVKYDNDPNYEKNK